MFWGHPKPELDETHPLVWKVLLGKIMNRYKFWRERLLIAGKLEKSLWFCQYHWSFLFCGRYSRFWHSEMEWGKKGERDCGIPSRKHYHTKQLSFLKKLLQTSGRFVCFLYQRFRDFAFIRKWYFGLWVLASLLSLFWYLAIS